MLATSAHLGRRRQRLVARLEEQGLDALVVASLPNIRYLTNFAGSAGLLVVTQARLYLLIDFRYSAAVDGLLASEAAPPLTTVVQVEGSYDEALVRVLLELGLRRIGFEADHVTVGQQARWASRLPADGPSLHATEGAIEGLRVVKDEVEVATLRAAADRLSEVARAVLEELAAPGRSERELAAEIDWRLKRAGFERTAFDTIVASGPNAALPHARPTDRLVEPGELLLLDFGGVCDGYCVDLTRTVATAAPVPAEARRLYGAVLAARQAAVAAVRPGVPADAVDRAAREVLEAEGLGEAFGHGTGHGLGLEVHEEPRVTRRRPGGPEPRTLEAGMVFTIEPGAYVPGFGGVRLEDDVLVTAEGCELLTRVPFDERLR
jgi:Xaa-Pro aminopeptidase